MKTFEKILEAHYIKDLEELQKSLQSKPAYKSNTNNAHKTIVNESAEMQIPEEFEETKLQHLDRIILIGEMRYKSLYEQDITLDYADPTKLQYEMSEGKIHVWDGEYEFYVTAKDAENTLVFIRSGYKNPIVSFLLEEIRALGITLLNNPESVNISNNKYLTCLLLSKYNIPQPKYCLVSKSDIHKGDHKELDKKLKTIYSKVEEDSKFVCKILGGHGGQGVFLCTGDNITSVLQTFFAIKDDVQILVQEYEKIKEGDVRAHVLTLNGKQELLNVSMRKKGTSDFRTNLSLGNTMEDYTLSDEQKDIVFTAAKASGLTWCGVDLLPLENGKNVILELNGAPGPPSEIKSDDLEKENEKFFKSFIDTVNKLIAE